MRLGVRALGVLIVLVSFAQNFLASIAEKAVDRGFHLSHRLDSRHSAVEQRGRFLKIIVVEFVWHRGSPLTIILGRRAMPSGLEISALLESNHCIRGGQKSPSTKFGSKPRSFTFV